MQLYLLKHFEIHSLNQKPKVKGLSEDLQREKIMQRFDNLFNLSFSQISSIREQARVLMIKDGDFVNAIDQLLLRAYISLEKLDVPDSS